MTLESADIDNSPTAEQRLVFERRYDARLNTLDLIPEDAIRYAKVKAAKLAAVPQYRGIAACATTRRPSESIYRAYREGKWRRGFEVSHGAKD